MKLSQLFPDLTHADTEIQGLALDSRRVKAGDLFLACAGRQHDGRRHIEQAVAAGAVAVAFEPDGFSAPALAVPMLAVSGLHQQLSTLADRFYGQPSATLQVVGITGTNGKTSVSQMLAQALNQLGSRCGVIGTLGSGFPDALIDHGMTTPDALAVQRQLASLQAEGARQVAIGVVPRAGSAAGCGCALCGWRIH